jgi:hypothetical protein
MNSGIISDFPQIFDEIERKAGALLYQGPEHGFGSSDFHGECDGKLNTTTIILMMNGFILTGFTPVAWNSSNRNKVDSSQKNFVFCLKNRRNNKAKKFSFSIQPPRSALRADSGGVLFVGWVNFFQGCPGFLPNSREDRGEIHETYN